VAAVTSVGELKGKVALVTGGAKNIGRAIADELASAGAGVAVLTRADAPAAAAVAESLRRRGAEAEHYVADVTDEAAVKSALAAIEARFGRLDVLVNNAAVRPEAPLAEISLDEWRRVLGVTLDGAFLCARTALPLLAASGAGAIVNIGGLTAYVGAEHRAHVVTAKAGLGGLTRALAVELAPHAITVNLVAPGPIDTVRDREPRHRRAHATLVGRRGTPNEVAAMVRYLAGPNARFITGQTIHVNGGSYLAP
jgi:3-oxoacyl-[acyl-carrier protein] reductase